MRLWWPAAGLGALSVAVHAWDLLKEVAIIFITSTIVWPHVNNREGTQLHPSTENWIKDLLSTAPPIRKNHFSSQSVSPIRKLPPGSSPPPSEGTQTENHTHRKLTTLITWTAALTTQRNYEPCCVGPPKIDRSLWRVLTKYGPLEKGMTTT